MGLLIYVQYSCSRKNRECRLRSTYSSTYRALVCLTRAQRHERYLSFLVVPQVLVSQPGLSSVSTVPSVWVPVLIIVISVLVEFPHPATFLAKLIVAPSISVYVRYCHFICFVNKNYIPTSVVQASPMAQLFCQLLCRIS
jgi:hypothetical protein